MAVSPPSAKPSPTRSGRATPKPRRNQSSPGSNGGSSTSSAKPFMKLASIVPASNTIPANVKVVTRQHLKKCLLDRGFVDAEKPDSVRAMTSKYINQLTGKKVIGADAKYVWLPKP